MLETKAETEGTTNRIADFYEVTKPNVSSLLVFTGAAAYVIAAGRGTSIFTLTVVALAVFLGSSAANTVGSYFDRDIDAIMNRTKRRPIPSGRIRPKTAAAYGLGLFGLSILLCFVFLSQLSALWMIVGFLDYTMVYSYLLKRRSSGNIILGGFSGVMPVLVGYFAASAPVVGIASALFAGFLVFLWIPEHIWSLSVRFKDDYTKAHVPMLPVVVSERTSVNLIAITSIIMVAYSIVVPLEFKSLGFGNLYLVSVAVLGALMIALNAWLLAKPTKERAWTVFKFSSPYLFFVFTAMMIDILLFGPH